MLKNRTKMPGGTFRQGAEKGGGGKATAGSEATKSSATAKSECIGRSRGGLSTKIPALCQAQGRPTALCLTGGQAHDLQGFDNLGNQLNANVLIGDRGYDADKRVRDVLAAKEITAVIPARKGRKEPMEHDKEMYKKRHKIENWFSRLKDYRALATRYDKLACNVLSGVYLAAAMT